MADRKAEFDAERDEQTAPIQQQPDSDGEKRGESVIRDLLGATLVATIDQNTDAETPETTDAVARPSLFDDESDADE